jgi:FMN phosphatase YigB (HAD superfamily)
MWWARGYLGKPDAAVYRKVQAALNAPSDALVMVDDAAKNLAPARILGWHTIWVNPMGDSADTPVDFIVRDLWQIAGAFHQLGVMDSAHRAIAVHRLAACAWARQAEAPA